MRVFYFFCLICGEHVLRSLRFGNVVFILLKSSSNNCIRFFPWDASLQTFWPGDLLVSVFRWELCNFWVDARRGISVLWCILTIVGVS